jgi:hypothetical protein
MLPCVLPNMKLELRNKGSPLQLAPKPTHTRRANIMEPKAPNMRVYVNFKKLKIHIFVL